MDKGELQQVWINMQTSTLKTKTKQKKMFTGSTVYGLATKQQQM